MATLADLIAKCHDAGDVKFTAPVLAEAVRQRTEAAEKAAALKCANLIGTFENNLKNHVLRLRELRKMEETQAELVKKIDRAFRYFGETGNPLPMFDTMGCRGCALDFCGGVGIDVPGKDDPAWIVPADWNPKQE